MVTWNQWVGIALKKYDAYLKKQNKYNKACEELSEVITMIPKKEFLRYCKLAQEHRLAYNKRIESYKKRVT